MMRSLLTFVLGLVLGAGALFVYLREIADAPNPIITDGGALPAPPGPATPATDAAPTALPANGALTPAAPAAAGAEGRVETDLSEANLPIRPATSASAAAGSALGTDGGMPDKLRVPVDGVALAQLRDTFDQPRGEERHHEALDIMAPKGTPVRAAGDGKIVKLFTSKPGGLTLYQFDPREQHAYYYAHLDRYADGIKEGMQVKQGALLGYVGVSGNADPSAPHLHFAVVALTPEKQWWKGTPVNPYPLLGN